MTTQLVDKPGLAKVKIPKVLWQECHIGILKPF